METSLITCVICPKGCSISVEWIEENGEKKIVSVRGNSCKRGEVYASQEVVDPKRVLTSTVKLVNNELNVLPIRSSSPIRKEKIFEAMDEIKKTVVDRDIKMGDVIIENIASTNVSMISCRDARKVK